MRLRRGFLGIVFQHSALIPSLSAAENVALVRGADGRLISRVSDARQALSRVGLDGRANHFPGQLSGGEQQRVAIARAMNGSPPVVVIDEPTASLDRKTADQIIKVLTDVRDSGHAVLVASHDQHVIDAADFVVSLD
jgi:putative ABC transport system ATP-binding protein